MPSRGPWTEWNAMKNVPNTSPRTIATRTQTSGSPRLIAMRPTASVARLALPRNHSVNWSVTLPWRSRCGM